MVSGFFYKSYNSFFCSSDKSPLFSNKMFSLVLLLLFFLFSNQNTGGSRLGSYLFIYHCTGILLLFFIISLLILYYIKTCNNFSTTLLHLNTSSKLNFVINFVLYYSFIKLYLVSYFDNLLNRVLKVLGKDMYLNF